MGEEYEAFWNERHHLGDAMEPRLHALPEGPVRTYLTGWVAAVQGRFDEAPELVRTALVQLTVDDIWRARAQRTMGDILGDIGDDLNAERHYIEAQRLFTLLGDTDGLVNTLQNSASLGYHSADSRRARLLEAMEIAEGLPDPELRVIIRINLGQVASNDAPEEARTWLEEALLLEGGRYPDLRARCLALLAGLDLDAGDLDAAERHLEQVPLELPVYAYSTRIEAAVAHSHLARRRGDHARAVTLLQGILDREMHPLQEIPIQDALATAYEAAGNLQEALDATRRAEHLWSELYENSATRRAHALDVWHRSLELHQRNASARDHIVTLEEALDELRRAHDDIQRMSVTDSLTGIHNRRFLVDEGPTILTNVTVAEPAQMAMLDLDDFKLVNDTYGHHVGDRVLTRVAALLRRHTRPADLVARHGGDEFVVLRPRTDTHSLAEDLRGFCAELRSTSMDGDNDDGLLAPGLSVGASVGVLAVTRGNLDEALTAADVLMYEAKRDGGDRVVTGRQDLMTTS